MPNAEHRFCVKHMVENFKIVFKKVETKMMWDAAGASTIKSFEAHMLKIKEVDEGAYDWMIKKEPKTWARCFFSPHAKCDAIQNNISESFNSYIK